MKTRIIVIGEYTPNAADYPEGADTTAYDRQSYEEGSIGLDGLLELCSEGTVTVTFEKIASSES